jgi:hypothetical protein
MDFSSTRAINKSSFTVAGTLTTAADRRNGALAGISGERREAILERAW